MTFDKPIARIAIVGIGLISASRAANYLARCFDVIAADHELKDERLCLRLNHG